MFTQLLGCLFKTSQVHSGVRDRDKCPSSCGFFTGILSTSTLQVAENTQHTSPGQTPGTTVGKGSESFYCCISLGSKKLNISSLNHGECPVGLVESAAPCFPGSETRGQLRLKGRLLGAPDSEWGLTAFRTQWLHFLSKGWIEANLPCRQLQGRVRA